MKKHVNKLLVIFNIVAKLIHVIRHCLNACIRKAIRERQEEDEEREKENVSVSRTRRPQPWAMLPLVSMGCDVIVQANTGQHNG